MNATTELCGCGTVEIKMPLDEKDQQYLEYFHIFRDLQHGQRDGGAGEEGRGSLPDIEPGANICNFCSL